MPSPDFVFSMKLAGRDQAERLLPDVAVHVFQYVGYPPSAIEAMVKELTAAVIAGAAPEGVIDVRFDARDGACEATVSVDGQEVWRTRTPKSDSPK